MNNQILERINFDFDIKNHRELSPYIYFTDTPLYSSLESQLGNFNVKDYHHCSVLFNKIQYIENKINIIKKDRSDKEKVEDLLKPIIREMRYSHDFNHSSSNIENLFSIQYDIIYNLINDSQYNSSKFKKIIKRNLMQMPISTALFPHYRQLTTSNYFFYDDQTFDLNSQNDCSENNEKKLNEILEKNEGEKMISLDDLSLFLDIISNQKKVFFTFSPTFVLFAIEKFNIYLNNLFPDSNINKQNDDCFDNNYLILKEILKLNESEEKQIKINYFKLLLLIKMKLFLTIQKLHEALSILLIFIVLEQNNSLELNIDDHFSFKKLFQESLPLTKKRSKILQNISSNEIIDFYCSPDEKNDFVITKNGLFRINQANELSQIEIDQKIVQNLSENNAKIYFSDEILYILTLNDKTIHKIFIQNEEKDDKKEENKKKHEYVKKEKEINEKRKNKRINKKLREKERREKRAQRKLERKEIVKNEINLDPVVINLPELPIVSIGVFDNYIRILQRKSYDNKKTTFIFTNVDLTPNSRLNFNVLEAFEDNYDNIKQYQTEVVIQDKNNQYKIFDACFSEDLLFFSFEDSTFEQWVIFQNGTIDLCRNSLSPYLFIPDSKLKIDNKSFLYVMEPVKNKQNSVSFTKMCLPETKYYIRSESELHVKYPYLQNLSDIVDNCTHFILNKPIETKTTVDEYLEINDRKKTKENKKDEIKQPNKLVNTFTVSPEEMSSVVQSPTAITLKMNELKELIKEIKDNELKQFFISLFIKISGINLLYCTRAYYSTKNTINDSAKDRFAKFRSFILDLLSIGKTFNSFNTEIMMKESTLFTFSLAAKYIFLPDKYQILHDIMNELFCNEHSKILLRNFSFYIFAYPSSLYIIDESILNNLLQYENDIKINELYMKSLLYILFEKKFAMKSMDSEFMKFISPYVQSAFKYIHHLLIDELEPLIKTEQIFSYFFAIEIKKSPFYSLSLLQEMSKIASLLFNRIKNVQGVIESDQEFEEKNQELYSQNVYKEIKTIESEHPYNSSQSETSDENKKIEKLEFIDFGPNIDLIYAIFDNKSSISKGDKITFYYNDDNKTFSKPIDFSFNQAIKINSNHLKVKISIESESNDKSLWGYKITFIGISFKHQFNWISNRHLHFYNVFVVFFCYAFNEAFDSTRISPNEKEFNLILNEKIIQGIKFEEIDNYEKQLNQTHDNEIKLNQSNKEANNQSKKLKRTLTRGISRGISFDTDNDSAFSDEFKKSFIKDFINAKEDNNSRGKQLLDLLYLKTAKKNRIRLNEATKSILENERYLAACLFKQLGLINVCLKLVNNVLTKNKNIDEIELPFRLQSVWKKIYSLRQALFFSYQKSKSNAIPNNRSDKNSIKFNFKQYSEEIKRKCILLLYSDPILKFKEKGNLDEETIESASSSIFSFVTSEISLSNISDLIDIRRKRLSLKTQSLSTLSSFLDQKSLFMTSKVFITNKLSNLSESRKYLDGITKKEFDDFHKLYNQTWLKFIEMIFEKASIATISRSGFLFSILFDINDEKNEMHLQLSKILMNLLENNNNNKFFVHDLTNLVIINILMLYTMKCKNNEIIDSFISLLFSDKIDSISKRAILSYIPLLYEFMPENKKIKDKSLAFSFLENNSNLPIVIRSSFYWLAIIFNADNNKNDELINKVLKGIGQSFVGESCLFIDDSFGSFTHRQVAEGMISFIRFLVNMKNETHLDALHDVLLNKINHINFNEDDKQEDIMMSIGLFSSIGQYISALEPERQIDANSRLVYAENESIIGYNPSYKKVRRDDSYTKKIKGVFSNDVTVNPNQFDLNEKEIDNILQLNEVIVKSKYFQTQQNYNKTISKNEINENVLISSFYSFLPIIMQNKNNASILMNAKNISKTLSIFKIAMNLIPTNENMILLLSHYLEKAIHSPTICIKNENIIDKNGSFRFMKMNYGEIIYNDDFDVIKSRKDHFNLFMATRPFDSENETYFELKIKQIGNKQIFIGFIDSEEKVINKAFGFGCTGQSKIFCRRSANLSKSIEVSNDKIMKKDQLLNEDKKIVFSINNGDRIGCYYTEEFVYLIVNGILTKYRLSHKSVNSYIPIIIIDHDEVELEITQNVLVVDKSNSKFDFLNIPSNDYFKEKDFINVSVKSKPYIDDDNIIEGKIYIGQNAFIDKSIFSEKESKMETIDVVSNDILRERENYAIIKDIIPIEGNPFVEKINLESYNHITLSKEIYNNVDSRYISFKKTTFFNLIENRMNTKLSMNNEFNLNSLPKELQDSFDYNLISNYIKTKTIKENSKSIAIIMSRYLVFILTDYLRYIKSPLLQDEGIESDEANIILNSLSISIPTITKFKPKFVFDFDTCKSNDFIIFKDGEEEEKKDEKHYRSRSAKIPILLPGFNTNFNCSFKNFLKKSENVISPKFITKLIQISFDNALSNDVQTGTSLYSLISPKYKFESISPLPNEYEIEKGIKRRELQKKEKAIGFMPILFNSIPDQLPELQCFNKSFRESTTHITCYNSLYDSFDINWKYDKSEIKEPFDFEAVRNYKLKFGLLLFTSQLPENLLNSQLSFIQILLNIIQVFNDSENLFAKFKEFLRGYVLEKLFDLSMKKSALAYPFLQTIVVMLISKFGFSDSIFRKDGIDVSYIFENLSKKLYHMRDFPTGKNELPLLFSIYSSLIQTRICELKNEKATNENNAVLFNKYYNVNEELFKISSDEEKTNNDKSSKKKNDDLLAEKEKKKNFRLFYLLYHYSSLLHKDQNLPYPTFLFVHDWLRQKFGSFRTTISKKDINCFKPVNIDENKDLIYKSNVFDNENDLCCSYQLFNIYEEKENNEENKKSIKSRLERIKKFKKDEKDEDKEKQKEKPNEKEIKPANKVFIHQLNDDKKIEIPQTGENVLVSFPLEILIVHEKDNESERKELTLGDVFIINFHPSEKMEKDCFIQNYNQIQNDMNQFISLEQCDNEIMEFINNENNDTEISNENNINIDNNNNNNDAEVNNDNNNNNDDAEVNNDNNNNNDDAEVNNDNNNNNDVETDNDNNDESTNKKDYAIYELQKLPNKSEIQIKNSPSSINSNVIALRYSILSAYRFLIESVMTTYTVDQDENDDDDDESGYSFWWRTSYYSDDKAPNQYMQHIIVPAYSMCTESKFIFINKIMKNETKDDHELQLIFNRFEQQKYFEAKEDSASNSYRPLFIQLMEQIDEDSIHLLKVRGNAPFRVTLVGEGAIDGGGPAREIFSSLIVEMMNDKLGIFTYNPNRIHQNKDTNKEDLIPNKESKSENQLLTRRFIYAGALIASCIVSSLPQSMKLASFIWEYLTKETVSIESIYEIDEDFKKLIMKAEFLENKINSGFQITDDEFKNNFLHSFEIRDSYNDVVELIPSGSNIPVTKENLHEFIQLAKKERIHEFDNELKQLKEGFDKIMVYKNIASILTPNELKLITCGEMNCNVEQMKKNMEIKAPRLRNEKIDEEQIIKMFWNVMESFSVDERMLFIRFTSGNLGLPAPGLKWDENITVYISSPEDKEKDGNALVTSSTCSSEATIPFFETEEELAKLIRISLKFFGMISDGRDELHEVSFDLF